MEKDISKRAGSSLSHRVRLSLGNVSFLVDELKEDAERVETSLIPQTEHEILTVFGGSRAAPEL